ncbi:hypothetical protein KGM_213424 [Danaus plexippus plexippus]|uniref:Uncharacterized protein n=1 Tax=Danaus plexippus plexippus TaxID=278856 RepID=A0A212ERL6_DANPL|nr:hypothetical protein KGM_213424 [Danaus plexippus plexippus]
MKRQFNKRVSWLPNSCRGGALAASRGSVSALLRSQAFALVSPRAISAYRARPTSESGRVGAQYERAAARPGTPLRLAGVFADGSKAKAPKYAQLIDPQGNVHGIRNVSPFVHFCNARAVSSVNRVARTTE